MRRKRKRKRFDETQEWEIVGKSPLVRFRPRRPMTPESRDVALPLAGAAARGKLESEFGRCVVLESLRLSRAAVADLLLLTRSGEVGLVECKRTRRGGSLKPVRMAVPQLARYERKLRRLTAERLRRRIHVSYDRFRFPPFRKALRRLGIRSAAGERRWWRRVEKCLPEGRIRFFVAAGGSGRPVDMWGIDHLPEVRV